MESNQHKERGFSEYEYSLSSFDFFLIMAGLGVAIFLAFAGLALWEWAS